MRGNNLQSPHCFRPTGNEAGSIRCDRHRGCAFLLASWVRLARDPNRRGRRFGWRSVSGGVHDYSAVGEEPVLRNGPLSVAQGRGVHAGAGGGIGAGQAAADSGTLAEWGPGMYGAESACRTYYGTAARNISRQEAARLAPILPAPLKRRPERMNHYSGLILERMRQMGW